MSKLLAVAARELRERWLLFPRGFVLGFVPLVLPAFGVTGGTMPDRRPVRPRSSSARRAAVVIGSSMLARDAANGRLGFLFSRPVSWPAIWGGKWLAALVLVVSQRPPGRDPVDGRLPAGVPRRPPRRLLAPGDARRTGRRPSSSS